MLAVSFAMTADAMLKPRPGGRYLTEQQIEGWTRQGDMLMPPNSGVTGPKGTVNAGVEKDL